MGDLKNYLLEKLDRSGTLEAVKNDLKSNLFNTLREDCPIKCTNPIENESAELAAEVVRDFFETFCMQYSLSVFLPESKLPEKPYQRELVEKKLGINGIEDLPLLSSVIASIKKTEEGSEVIGESVNSSTSFNNEEFLYNEKNR